ncbi:YmaF family protein [Pelotomaculum isophthalicicum]|uniref:YmaF family protein n=1 Tax=Pelotomaculum isophthalicicum TaxID=342448 RepID=UPI003B84AFBA
MHTHNFYGGTSYDDGHMHLYQGTTTPSPEGPSHTHHIYVRTTTEQMHDHLMDVETGPPIPIQWGHVHYFSGTTSINGAHPHSHRFGNVTNPSK